MLNNISDRISGLALFIEREAGHSLLSLILIILGMRLMDPVARAQAAHDLVVFGLGVMARSMGMQHDGGKRGSQPEGD